MMSLLDDSIVFHAKRAWHELAVVDLESIHSTIAQYGEALVT